MSKHKKLWKQSLIMKDAKHTQAIQEILDVFKEVGKKLKLTLNYR